MVALLNQFLAFLFSGNASSTFGSISHSGGVNICNVNYVIINESLAYVMPALKVARVEITPVEE